jgi:hypothetical protein
MAFAGEGCGGRKKHFLLFNKFLVLRLYAAEKLAHTNGLKVLQKSATKIRKPEWYEPTKNMLDI